MKTVLSVLGTRPEAIKMAPVIRHLTTRSSEIRSVVCSTGQHREMLDQVFGLFDIRPDVELNLMRPNQTLVGLTARLFEALDEVVRQFRPDWILAQGDTTTVMVTSLVAFYGRIKFGHIEAGLRTGDLNHPFPEELHRRVADEVSTLLFAPTARSRKVLLDAGFPQERVLVTGNTVIDALQYVSQLPFDGTHAPWHDTDAKRIVLVTAHRRESFGEPFKNICLALRDLSQRWGPQGVEFVYPVHLNPQVREPVGEILGKAPHVRLLNPIDYLELIQLLRRSTLVLTDSGGIQEEAPGLRVPVLVMRDTTERPEGVAAGVAKLVGTTREGIVSEVSDLLANESRRQAMMSGQNPYGDGQAAKRIVDAIQAYA